MDIEKINNRHFFETEMYCRMEMGLSSRLLSFKNGIFHIEMVIHPKWDKSYNMAAIEMAQLWRDGNLELTNAFACKVFIIDARKNQYKDQLSEAGVKVDYDAKKGVLFYKQHLN
jgi:hypothetical protein